MLIIHAQTAIIARTAPAPPQNVLGVAAAPCRSKFADEVIVCATEGQDRYRIPAQLRSADAHKPAPVVTVDQGLRDRCSSTGNSPCGTAAIPVLTIRGGQTYIGPPPKR